MILGNPLRVLRTLAAAVGAPLWCRVAGHGEPVGPTEINGTAVWVCERCGAYLLQAEVRL